MLVLTRKLQQEIVIADDIRVTVLEIDRNRIRLGITAPTNVPIHRVEIVHDRKLLACAALSPTTTRLSAFAEQDTTPPDAGRKRSASAVHSDRSGVESSALTTAAHACRSSAPSSSRP